MMEYDHQCKMGPTMPLKYPCTHSSTHLATLVIINLCPVMMSQSGDITLPHHIHLDCQIWLKFWVFGQFSEFLKPGAPVPMLAQCQHSL
jgi:hypothetical protein